MEQNEAGEPSPTQIDLALLLLNELHVGGQPMRTAKKPKPLYLRYEIDGDVIERSYLSPLSWRAVMMFAASEGKDMRIHEMDLPGRYRSLFPQTLLRRLAWHARSGANAPPVARLYDPYKSIELLLTRSRLCGHSVDALHNLNGMPMFQALWVSDIMALRPLFGIALVRDASFSASMPIGAYLEAAAATGRIVLEPELADVPLIGSNAQLLLPEPSKYAVRIFEQQCAGHATMEAIRHRSIYEDYGPLGPM